MTDLPVSFTFNNKEYTGVLSPVSGGGGMWFLFVQGYFKGQLLLTSSGWRFYSQSGKIDYLSKELGELVEKARCRNNGLK